MNVWFTQLMIPALISQAYFVDPVDDIDISSDLASDVKEQVVDSLNEIITQKLQKAKNAMLAGEYKTAGDLLHDILIVNEDHKEAKELLVFNERLLNKRKRLKLKQRERQLFDRDPLVAAEEMAFNDGRLGKMAKHQMTKKSSSDLKWVRNIKKQLEETSEFYFESSGQDALKQIMQTVDFSVLVSPQLNNSKEFKESLDVTFKNISLKNVFNHLARRWGVYWIMHDGAVVFLTQSDVDQLFSQKLPQQPADGYRPPDFDSLDLGGFGLPVSGFGLQTADQNSGELTNTGNNLTGLVVIQKDTPAVLVEPKTVRGKGKN